MKPSAILSCAIALSLAGCGQLLQQLEGGSSGAGGGSSSATTGTGGPAQGINCGVDPSTSATLCLGITTCPGLTIDQEVFPECGFRVNGSVVDVECSCGGFLCPLGSSTCADAEMLLAQQNEGTVCAKVSDGICAAGVPSTTSAAAGSSSSGGSCSQDCIASCDNDPVCLQACGC